MHVNGKREIQSISGSGGLHKFAIYNAFIYISPDNVKWPDEELIPGFRDVLERYLGQVEDLSYRFSSLIAEAFGLGPDGLTQFYDIPSLMQHRSKIVQYPVVEGSSDQGVGPHYDAGFLTFVRFKVIQLNP